jgi:putative nucleotidyltransferase with HDIG domain
MAGTVLVVSNDVFVRELLTSLLGEEGFRVTLAGTGAEALKIAANAKLDFALLESFLSDYSGVELKRRIGRLSPKTHVVVLSSFTAIRSSEDVLRFGASDFIVDQRELLGLMRAAEEPKPPPAPAGAGEEQLKRCLIETIDVLVGLLEVNDPFFGGNSHMTMEYARAVAEEMKLPAETIDEIVVASLLHDIGRIGIKSEILSGKKEISESEYRMIQSHCENGAKILEAIDFPWKIRPIIIHHHERFDGKGYPGGLKGREIPVGARILAVVDAFAAMTANRPHRGSLSREEAVRELHRNVGTQFDPEIVEIFTGLVERKFYFRGVGEKPRVMLVDDEVDYLMLLKLRLVNEGFDVVTADNAADALKLMEQAIPDLVVCDVVMPGIDGITLFKKMRGRAGLVETPLIFLSAKDETQFKVEALHQGAEDYLVKPVDMRELAARCRNIIRRDARRKAGAPAAGGNPGVTGDLRNLSVPDIVQTLYLGLKTACVTVREEGGDEGQIYFENGRVRHCRVGTLTGEEAFYRIIRIQEGPFTILHGKTSPQRTVARDEMQLVMEGLRRMDEAGREDAPR